MTGLGGTFSNGLSATKLGSRDQFVFCRPVPESERPHALLGLLHGGNSTWANHPLDPSAPGKT